MQYKFADIIKQSQNAQQKTKKRKKITIFFICFILSAIFWLIIQLSTINTLTLSFPIKYSKITKKFVITNQQDSVLKITLKSKSFNLILTRFLNSNHLIEIDLSDFISSSQKVDNIIINTKKFSDQITSNFVGNIEITKIYPDSINFKLEKTVSKKIPIKFNSDFKFENNYFIYDKLQITPDSVNLYGRSDELNNINYIENKTIKEKKISANIETTSDLIYDKSKFILSHENIKVFVPVEKYTETNFTIPVTNKIKINNSLTYKTFPDKIKITVLVAQKDYKNINADMFLIGFDNQNQMNSKSIKLKILKQPKNVKITKINPEKVDFIIIK